MVMILLVHSAAYAVGTVTPQRESLAALLLQLPLPPLLPPLLLLLGYMQDISFWELWISTWKSAGQPQEPHKYFINQSNMLLANSACQQNQMHSGRQHCRMLCLDTLIKPSAGVGCRKQDGPVRSGISVDVRYVSKARDTSAALWSI
jgi:hypothetical protein